MFGRDPNWGRIICASGNAGVPFDYTTTDLYIGTEEEMFAVLQQGQPVSMNRIALKKKLRESHIQVEMQLNQGDAEATAWGTDLTTDYVMFNSVYTT
jgi:N-acetylglutamate synthase (N-acetylornithine aminotransferase)